MQNRDVLKHHANLVDRMAETLGLDLEEAALRGDLPPGEIADAVLRCTNCSNPGHCAGWLAEHPAGAPATPGYCRNAELFADLKLPQRES